jgi:hypothetical protein
MNWQDIKVSSDNTFFLYKGTQIYSKKFIAVLKFHSPGLAPVMDETGAYHIDTKGKQIYTTRFTRTFGYYCNRAAVVDGDNWFHINEFGLRSYSASFAWIGNYQEYLCPVRNKKNHYYHIDLNGNRIYSHNFIYCGDFKDGIACIKSKRGFFKHIDRKGNFICEKEFLELGVFHKNYATAKDKGGWFHIDKKGNEIYPKRYLNIEPYYNGFALVTQFDYQKVIIDEQGNKILTI